jgi:hypothetical protein
MSGPKALQCPGYRLEKPGSISGRIGSFLFATAIPCVLSAILQAALVIILFLDVLLASVAGTGNSLHISVTGVVASLCISSTSNISVSSSVIHDIS